MMGKTLGWLGLTVVKPRGRSLCVWGVASGSAASHSDPGSFGMVELSEESHFFAAETRPFRGREEPAPPEATTRSRDCYLSGFHSFRIMAWPTGS